MYVDQSEGSRENLMFPSRSSSDWKLVPLLLLFLLRQFEYHLYRLCFATAARLNVSFAHKSPLKRIAGEAEEEN